MRTPTTLRPTVRRATALCCLGALLLAGCGTSGGETATTTAPGATTTAEPSGGSTEPAVDPASEDDTDGPAGEVDEAALEALLPEAEDVDPGFRSNSDVEEGYDEPDDLDEAFAEDCPTLGDLTNDVVDDGRVGRLYEDDDDRGLKAVLDPTPDSAFDEDRLDITIAAAQGCADVTWESGTATFATEVEVERDDAYGDRGVVVRVAVDITGADLPGPLAATFETRAYVVGSVLVVVSSSDGLDDDLAVVPADHDLVDVVAADLAEQLAALGD